MSWQGFLLGNNLIGFFSVQLRLPYHFTSLEVFQHALDDGLMLYAEVADNLLLCLDAIRSLPEIGNEIQNINFFYVS